MAITLAILGLCIGVSSAGLALYALSYSISILPSASDYQSIIKLYWVTANILVIGAILIFLVFGIGRLFIKYKVSWKMLTGDMPISFHLSCLERLILLGIMPEWGAVRAEVRYQYGEVSGWQHACIAEWKQQIGVEAPVVIGSEVNIRSPRDKLLISAFKRVNGQFLTVHPDQQILPARFTLNIKLVRADCNKIISEKITHMLPKISRYREAPR